MRYQNILGKGFTVQFIEWNNEALKQMLVHVRLMQNVYRVEFVENVSISKLIK